MARITIEDCTEKVPNRFHLVKMASIRAKQLKKGAQPLVSNEDNKEVVVSLREIAAGFVKPDYPDTDALDTRVETSAEEGAPEAPLDDSAIEADPDS